jgi:hypothetical protein
VSDPCSDSEVCLPSEVQRLLLDVVADGFVLYCCGPSAAPFALVASYQWDSYVDLVAIRRLDRVITARVRAPPHGRVDVFTPEAVVWAYEGPPQWALRALFDLVHPLHPHAPASAYPAPPSLRIPRAEQRPMTIRLPPPGRPGIRAALWVPNWSSMAGYLRRCWLVTVRHDHRHGGSTSLSHLPTSHGLVRATGP